MLVSLGWDDAGSHGKPWSAGLIMEVMSFPSKRGKHMSCNVAIEGCAETLVCAG